MCWILFLSVMDDRSNDGKTSTMNQSKLQMSGCSTWPTEMEKYRQFAYADILWERRKSKKRRVHSCACNWGRTYNWQHRSHHSQRGTWSWSQPIYDKCDEVVANDQMHVSKTHLLNTHNSGSNNGSIVNPSEKNEDVIILTEGNNKLIKFGATKAMINTKCLCAKCGSSMQLTEIAVGTCTAAVSQCFCCCEREQVTRAGFKTMDRYDVMTKIVVDVLMSKCTQDMPFIQDHHIHHTLASLMQQLGCGLTGLCAVFSYHGISATIGNKKVEGYLRRCWMCTTNIGRNLCQKEQKRSNHHVSQEKSTHNDWLQWCHTSRNNSINQHGIAETFKWKMTWFTIRAQLHGWSPHKKNDCKAHDVQTVPRVWRLWKGV